VKAQVSEPFVFHTADSYLSNEDWGVQLVNAAPMQGPVSNRPLASRLLDDGACELREKCASRRRCG
jgi:hypothetical protein